jgi:hypothetical protein
VNDPLLLAGAAWLTVLWAAGFGIFYLSYRLAALAARVWHTRRREALGFRMNRRTP